MKRGEPIIFCQYDYHVGEDWNLGLVNDSLMNDSLLLDHMKEAALSCKLCL